MGAGARIVSKPRGAASGMAQRLIALICVSVPRSHICQKYQYMLSLWSVGRCAGLGGPLVFDIEKRRQP